MRPINAVYNYLNYFFIISILIGLLQYTYLNYIDYTIFIFSIFILILTKNFLVKIKIKIYKGKLFFCLFLIYVIILTLGTYKYPIFPAFRSGDFKIYILNALNLMNKQSSSFKIPANPAINILLAGWLSLSPWDPVISVRIFVFLISLLLPFYIYVLGLKLFKENSIIITLIFILNNPIWIYVIYISGLYANLFGIIIALYFLTLLIEIKEKKPAIKECLILFLTSFILIISHSTNFLVISSIWIASICSHLYKKNELNILYLISISSPIFIILFFMPHLIFRLPTILHGPFSEIIIVGIFQNFLRKISPFVMHIYLQGGYIILILLICSLISSLYTLWRNEMDFGLKIIFFWLLFSWLLSYFSNNVWRFSLVAITPICILSGILYKMILPFYLKIKVILPSYYRRIFKYELIILLIILLILGGYLHFYIPLTFNNALQIRTRQLIIYDTMIWLRDNTPKDAIIFSVGRWEFMFTPFIAERSFLGDTLLKPYDAYKILKKYKHSYIVVWNLLHENNTYYVNLYEESGLFKEVWCNDIVTIFIPIDQNLTTSS